MSLLARLRQALQDADRLPPGEGAAARGGQAPVQSSLVGGEEPGWTVVRPGPGRSSLPAGDEAP